MLCIPALAEDGLLPEGFHFADSWEEIMERFGTNSYRNELLTGLRLALESLRAAGCTIAYLDGSFVTEKEFPRDFDGCWELEGVDLGSVDPILLDVSRDGRRAQKAKFRGELFPGSEEDGSLGELLGLFRLDKYSGREKGIVALQLVELL